MADSQGYEPVLSARVTTFLLRLPKTRQRRLVDLLFRLSSNPTQTGDYSVTDDLGREIQFILVGDLLIGFWPDHAVEELRIVEIEEV